MVAILRSLMWRCLEGADNRHNQIGHLEPDRSLPDAVWVADADLWGLVQEGIRDVSEGPGRVQPLEDGLHDPARSTHDRVKELVAELLPVGGRSGVVEARRDALPRGPAEQFLVGRENVRVRRRRECDSGIKIRKAPQTLRIVAGEESYAGQRSRGFADGRVGGRICRVVENGEPCLAAPCSARRGEALQAPTKRLRPVAGHNSDSRDSRRGFAGLGPNAVEQRLLRDREPRREKILEQPPQLRPVRGIETERRNETISPRRSVPGVFVTNM